MSFQSTGGQENSNDTLVAVHINERSVCALPGKLVTGTVYTPPPLPPLPPRTHYWI